MNHHLSLAPLSEVRDDVLSGHLWLTEYVTGDHLRFRMESSGLLQFGDADSWFVDLESLPPPSRLAVEHVRDRFERETFRTANIDPECVVFHGVATYNTGVPYDWTALPPFVGHDIWLADSNQYRPPGVSTSIFESLGMTTVSVFARELHARDFDPESYSHPQSAWYDGMAAGVVVRNKTGDRAVIWPPEGRFDTDPNASSAPAVDCETLVDQLLTNARLARITAALTRRGTPVTAEALTNRSLLHLWREHPCIAESEDKLPALKNLIRDRCRAYITSET